MSVKKVAIIGAGVMGSSIAQVVAQAGFDVIIRTRRGKKGLDRLFGNIQKAQCKNILTGEQVEALLSKIEWTVDLSGAGKTDLVIEAVEENMAIKKDILGELDNFCLQHTILASNTSSLSISQLAKVTNRPEKVIGLHFFNPVYAMKLVEIIPASLTSKETVETVIGFSQKLGKTPIVVRESPGFVVNRILMPMINEAIYLFMEEVTSAENIDVAMKLGANHPIGPLALADLIGLDVCLMIMVTLHGEFNDPKYQPCSLLEEMVQKGYLGRKTGRGFFLYK